MSQIIPTDCGCTLSIALLTLLGASCSLRVDIFVDKPDVVEPDLSSFEHVDKTAGRSDQQMASACKIFHLVTDVGTAIYDTWAHVGAVGELLGFIIDMRGQVGAMTSPRGYSVAVAACILWDVFGWPSSVKLAEKWDEEGSGLTRTCPTRNMNEAGYQILNANYFGSSAISHFEDST